MLTPHNTSHNRKLQLLEASGKIVAIKNGEVYFYMVVNGAMQYFKSEENFFHKNGPKFTKNRTVTFGDLPLKILMLQLLLCFCFQIHTTASELASKTYF